MEKISIIVPIYNVEKYLEKCVESLINQTYKNLEIILVDDESPDNCPKICDDYLNVDSRIKVIHQKNMGLSGARNSGIKIATGEYLVFQDSDDTLELNAIELLYKNMKKHNTKLSICGRYNTYEDGRKICKYKEQFEKKYDFISSIEEMNKFYYFDMSACGKLYKRELFDGIEFPIGRLSEDYYIMYKLFERAGYVSFISTPLYNYLQRQNSISKNKKINNQIIDAARCQMNDLENYSEEMKTIVHVAYAYSFLIVVNIYIKQHVKFSMHEKNEYRQEIRKNLTYIKNYKNLDSSRKIQFILFLYCLPLYKIIYKLYKKKEG